VTTNRARTVDGDLLAELLQRDNLRIVLDKKALQQEGRLDPRTIQFEDKHALFNQLCGDSLDHRIILLPLRKRRV
jgi:hypothetical protein